MHSLGSASLRFFFTYQSLEILSSYQRLLKGTNLTNPYPFLVQASYPSMSDGASVVKKTTIHLDQRDKRKTGSRGLALVSVLELEVCPPRGPHRPHPAGRNRQTLLSGLEEDDNSLAACSVYYT